MEIEKICRTCLSLSGPLLSIYDGAGGGGTISDMLSNFTKTKPKPADNLPEKVCLSCISEINHCYSFKLKCENSNRMLRQLLPNALPDEDDIGEPVKVQQCHKFVQTIGEKVKQVASVEVQTIKEDKAHRHVQTEVQTETGELTTSPLNHKQKVNIIKVEKAEILAVAENSLKGERRHTTRSIAVRLESSLKRKLSEEGAADEIENEQNGNEIILELDDDANDDNAFAESVANPENFPPPATDDDDDNASYYEISYSNLPEDQHIYTEEDQAEDQAEDETEEMIEVRDESDTHQTDYDYTIYKNDNGNAEIVASSVGRQTRSQTTICAQKVELKCSNCAMTFISEKSLKRHMLKRHGFTLDGQPPPPPAENVLPMEMHAALIDELKDEVKLEKSESKLQASIPAIFAATTPAKLKFFCERCSAGFAVLKSLHYHIKLNACTMKSYQCDECDRVFNSMENLGEHKATHVLANVCNECNQMYETKDELTRHMIDEHNRKIRNQCNVCKKIFTMLSALKDHMRIHSGEKPYLCPLCGKAFSQNANLKQHIARHSKEKKFKCDECSNGYVTKAELFSHKRTHTGDQPFSCEFCSTCFTTSSSLVKHKRKHTGERPYACDICPMRFTALNVLKNHRRTHTGEKPYRCNFCPKGFTQKGDCQIHQRTHTGEKKYTCECGMKFTHLGTLRAHVRTHEKDKHYLKKRRISLPVEESETRERSPSVNVALIDVEEEEDDDPEAGTTFVDSSGDEDLVQMAMNDMC